MTASGQTEAHRDAEDARELAAARAHDKAVAWAEERAAADRRKARRKRLAQIVVVGIFLIMLFERAVRGGLF